MRDLLVVGIVVVGSLMALRRPWIGIMLWTWLSIMNPHRYTYGFAYSTPLAAVVAGVTVLGLLLTRERESPFKGAPVNWLLTFLIWMTLSWLFGENIPGDFPMWSKVIKICFMLFVALALLGNRYQIMAFLWITVFSLAALGAKGGLFTLITGGNYRVWGPPGSFIEDNNAFALALVSIIPLIRFLQLQVASKIGRTVLTLVMLLCAAAALGSYSRGAFLAIGSMAAMFWWRTRNKFASGMLLALIGVSLLVFMPEAWWGRMDTIETYHTDMSAIGRLNGWAVAIQVALHNFFGAGMSYQYQEFFSRFGVYNTNVIAAHSIYFQVLGNHGFFGLLLFLCIWFSCYRSAGWLRKNATATPEAKWAADLGAMAQVSLIAYGVGGAFLSLAYYDLPYNILVAVVLARKWYETRGWERDPAMSPLEYAGFRKKKRPAPRPASGMKPSPAAKSR